MNKFLLVFLCCITIVSYSQTDTSTTPQSINNAETDTVRNGTSANLPIFNGTSSDVGGNNAQSSQDVTALLGSSRDIFYQTVAMHFIASGGTRFHMRGYSQDNFTVMMNGVRINSLESGGASWSTWGGMTDVIRFMDVKPGLGSSRSTFGDVGGFFNLNVYASSFRKGLRVAYAQGNRIYKERVTLTYSTGLLKSGWAFSASGTARYAAQGYVPGTFFQGFGYFLGADKKLNEKNTLSFIGFGAPITQGRQSYETDEAFALTGDKHYNSFWGYQNGQVRNSRISTNNVPTAIGSDVWNINDHSKLTTSAFYSFGRTSLTGLNYYNAPNPAPDYYEYMPSYYGPSSNNANPTQFAALTQNWANPVNQQINWANLYNANYDNMHTVNGVDGVTGKSYTGKMSEYIVEEKRQDVNSTGFNSIYNTRTNNNFFITGGVNLSIAHTRYYKVVNDLLGGDYWLDLNNFAVPSPNPMVMQNNINDPNKLIRKGDVFGYDYNINVTRAETWGQVEKSYKKIDMFASATLNETSFYRDGHMVNGLFPNTSGGRSTTLNFINYGFKFGATYKLNGHNYFTFNAAAITKPPLPTNTFVSPQTRNDEIPNLTSEKILTGDISYNVRLPWLKGRITYYYTQTNNQVWERSYYDDVYKTNVNYFMTNLNQLNQGLELGLEGIVTKHISIIGALAYGSYLYTNRPTATISADNSAALLASDRTIYFKNYHVGGTPEVASSIGVRYTGKKQWYAGVYFNYFANNYVTANPDRRTAQALTKYVSTDPQVAQITTQEKLPNAYTLDFMGGKSFRFQNKYGLNLTLMVNNLTNNMFKVSGEEQLRHDDNNIGRFPNKYVYSLGLTYMLSAAFLFN